MDKDEQEQLNEQFLQEQYHENQMRNNLDYFYEYLLDNMYFDCKHSIDIIDVINELKKECSLYDQNLDDLLDYLKEL